MGSITRACTDSHFTHLLLILLNSSGRRIACSCLHTSYWTTASQLCHAYRCEVITVAVHVHMHVCIEDNINEVRAAYTQQQWLEYPQEPGISHTCHTLQCTRLQHCNFSFTGQNPASTCTKSVMLMAHGPALGGKLTLALARSHVTMM